jgi:hypothetical protein
MPDRSSEKEAAQGAAKSGDTYKWLESGELDAFLGSLETYRTTISCNTCQKELKECG